jgi:O-acetyl-ADP-ribose deacetylase
VLDTLRLAENYGCKSVALPALSSGIFGFPKRLCAKVMFDAVEKFAEKHQNHEYLQEIHFTNFDLNPTVKIFQEEFLFRYC